ncbi:Uncharacterized protein HZ326_1802 [Fusarium oxysporum f. sp. albedinis]|nr:Uncharacterized protein HZ326_1802 [Fusarium oxysporum f. sp. albedinis]
MAKWRTDKHNNTRSDSGPGQAGPSMYVMYEPTRKLQFVEFIKITTYIFVFPLWDCYAKAWGKLGGLPAEAAASTGRAII